MSIPKLDAILNFEAILTIKDEYGGLVGETINPSENYGDEIVFKGTPGVQTLANGEKYVKIDGLYSGLIYTSRNYARINQDNEKAPDMFFADKDWYADVNDNLYDYWGLPNDVLEDNFRAFKGMISSPLDKVWKSFVDWAMTGSNWGRGIPDYAQDFCEKNYKKHSAYNDHEHNYDQYTNWSLLRKDFSNTDLTNAIFNDKKTLVFINGFKKGFKKLMKKNKFCPNNINIDQMRGYMDNNVDRINFKNINLFKPTIDNGLLLLVHTMWSVRIDLVHVEVYSDQTYKGKIKVTFFDHFGLDDNDIRDYKPAGWQGNFLSWYTLQHRKHNYSGYQPFVTRASKEIDISSEE